MVHAFVGAKGGVSATVTAMRSAAAAASEGVATVLVDITGDAGLVLDTGDRSAAASWRSADVGVAALSAAGHTSAAEVESALRPVPERENLYVLHHGGGWVRPDGLGGIASALDDLGVAAVADAGSGAEGLTRAVALGGSNVLVVENCYAALVRARQLLNTDAEFERVVYRIDQGRALALDDIENAMGWQGDAVLATTDDWARWADLGLVLERDGDETEAAQLAALVRSPRHRTVASR